MNTEQTMKMREIREWATFVLSFLTVAAIPIGMLILRNVQFEIKQDISRDFVSQSSYTQDKDRLNEDRRQELQTIGVIQGKLDSMLVEQIHTSDNLALLKEQLSRKPAP